MIEDSADEDLPTPEAENTCARISFCGFVTCLQEALWRKKLRNGIHRGVVNHVPRARQPC